MNLNYITGTYDNVPFSQLSKTAKIVILQERLTRELKENEEIRHKYEIMKRVLESFFIIAYNGNDVNVFDIQKIYDNLTEEQIMQIQSIIKIAYNAAEI